MVDGHQYYPRVCEELFKDKFWIDQNLKEQLDVLIQNVKFDWDFVLVISGSGNVRVGKSVLAAQIAQYWSYQMKKVHKIDVPFDLERNVIFNYEKLIKAGNDLGVNHKHFVLIYDEAGETMEGTKTMTGELKAIRDYLRECGQYNSLTILVLPEFFDLPKGIALTRSTALLDVHFTVGEDRKFERGYFNFYSKQGKKHLYLKGKKELNYHAHQYSFRGRFPNFFPFDLERYKTLKKEALRTRETVVFTKRDKISAIFLRELMEATQMSSADVIRMMKDKYDVKIPPTTLSTWLTSNNLGNPTRRQSIYEAPLLTINNKDTNTALPQIAIAPKNS